MREILFRGKRIDNGEWIEGLYLVTKDIVSEEILHIIVRNPADSCGREIWDFEAVDPSSISQYTGLTDKNGEKIFEGDILSIARKSNGMGDYYYPPLKYPSNAIVKWDKCSWMWEIIAKSRYYLTFPNAWCHFGCEVIGNAIDNPELLEVGE